MTSELRSGDERAMERCAGMCVPAPHRTASAGVLDGWELSQQKEKQICFLPFPDEDAEP